MEVQETAVQTDRILTVPNLLSFLRLLGVPLFLWLVLVKEWDGWAFAVFAASAFTDYLDGVVARRWHQISRLGQVLDPLADRLYTLAAIVALTIREFIPLWLAIVLVARDVFMTGVLLNLRRFKIGPLPVHFLGKLATFFLLSGFPLLLLGGGEGNLPLLAKVFGWALILWGVALYWWAAFLYAGQARQLVRGRG